MKFVMKIVAVQACAGGFALPCCGFCALGGYVKLAIGFKMRIASGHRCIMKIVDAEEDCPPSSLSFCIIVLKASL
jgi:hypothetical protein